MTHHSGYKLRIATKVHLFNNKLIYPTPFYLGFAGSVDDAHSILEWFMEPDNKPPRVKASEYIILSADKKIFTFTNPHRWIEIGEQYYSIGSGAQYALGALAAGKSPKEAVEISAKCDPHTGMGVKTFTFEQKEKGPIKAPKLAAE
jgi:ATP-dependent protease HslVU (ClpYQ) peptidase subunit